MEASQNDTYDLASNANVAAPSKVCVLSGTGGSWKKSPDSTSCAYKAELRVQPRMNVAYLYTTKGFVRLSDLARNVLLR